MNKSLFFVLMLLASATVKAQVGEFRNDLAVGGNIGCNINSVAFNPTINQSMKPGIQFGATLRYTCEKYYAAVCAFQTEINFAQLGWKEIITTSSDTYTRTLNYVQIPILARLGFGRERKGVMGYIIIGPQLGLYIGDHESKGGEWSEETLALRPNGVIQQYTEKVKTFDYGLTGGAGIELSFPKVGHFMLEGRYYYALGDIFPNSKKDPFARSNNGAIVVKLTYLFDIIKTKGVTIK